MMSECAQCRTYLVRSGRESIDSAVVWRSESRTPNVPSTPGTQRNLAFSGIQFF